MSGPSQVRHLEQRQGDQVSRAGRTADSRPWADAWGWAEQRATRGGRCTLQAGPGRPGLWAQHCPGKCQASRWAAAALGSDPGSRTRSAHRCPQPLWGLVPSVPLGELWGPQRSVSTLAPCDPHPPELLRCPCVCPCVCRVCAWAQRRTSWPPPSAGPASPHPEAKHTLPFKAKICCAMLRGKHFPGIQRAFFLPVSLK